jgi:hypothetical protein
VTRHPASAWVVQQLREACPYDSAPGYPIFDLGTQFLEFPLFADRLFPRSKFLPKPLPGAII